PIQITPAGGYTVASGPHTLTAQNASGCISAVTNITVNAQPPTPAAPTVNVTQPTCTVATGTITITSATAGLTFSLDGGAYAAYPAGGYTVASGPHTLTAQNASGCISAVTNITVNAQPPTPAAPTVNVTQPTCTVATGTITITSATAGLTFSLDGGAYAAYPAGGYTVASGPHTLTAQNASGCISAVTNITVNAQPPTPAAPTVNVTQPTCTVATGTITITSATAGLTFSLDGGAYAAYPAGGYTVASGPHTLTAQNASGCISAVTNITVNAQPPTPAAPTVNVTQPTCTVATGTITITSATAGLTFSLDGGAYAAYPAGGYTVASGPHTLTAQNASGCISAVTNITVNAQPPTPAAPTVNVTQPTCTVATGTITITSATAGLTFSLDGGAYAAYPAGGYTVASGPHTLTAQNASGCISAVTNITVNAQPPTPAAPTVNVTQPTCTVATGTITITSATAGLTFSLDGGAYAAYPAGGYTVASGPHTLTAQNASGCISAVTNITVNAQPPTPAAPTVNVTQPTCTVATGTITVTSATAGLTFSLDGGAYAAYPAGGYTVASGPHTLTAQNASGCIFAVTNITFNAQPPTPAAPTVNVTQPTCTDPDGTITITSATAGLTFSLDGGAYAAYPAGGYTVASVPHTLTAQNASGGISAVTNITVNAQPPTPAAPTVNVTQPTCADPGGTITITSATA